MGICLTNIASYVPDKVLSNADLEKTVDTHDEWIRKHTGIQERRICGLNEASSDLMIPAARKVLASSGLNKVDAVVVTTPFPDRLVEHVSDTFAKKLGLPDDVLAIDVIAECSGFPWAIASAVEMMENPRNLGRFQTVMVVSGDATSKFVDQTDRSTVVLFGDAGAAGLLQNIPGKRGVIGWRRASDRTHMDCMQIAAGGSAKPTSLETIAAGEHYMKFSFRGGAEMKKDIIELTPPLLKETCADYGLVLDDIDLLVPHQVNIQMTQPLEEILIKEGLRANVMFDDNIAKYGNCSCSSAPLALDTAYRQGRIKPGNIVVIVTWGAGLKIGILIMEWTMPKFQGGK